MPTSDPGQISPVAQQILKLSPKSVLDIGVGYGKWGSIVREYTDVWAWRFYPNEWTTIIHGVEPHTAYKSHNWHAYNKIYTGKIQDIILKLQNYDLILFIDTLEHIEKNTAKDLLSDIMMKTKHLIVSYCNNEQHNVRDNALEDHISKWNTNDFTPYGNIDVLYTSPDGACLLISAPT